MYTHTHSLFAPTFKIELPVPCKLDSKPSVSMNVSTSSNPLS